MRSYVEENHDGLAFAHHTARRNVYCPLLKRETLVAKTATTGLHDNLVAIENRGKKISLYISYNGYDVLQTEIRREYLTLSKSKPFDIICVPIRRFVFPEEKSEISRS